jgi:hypothetical protein
MNRLLALLFYLMSCLPAAAGVPCSLPFNLQNGQPADATQVMANYNALVSCFGNAAAAGVNNDITQITGLTTPLAPAFGGTQTFVANASSTGSANAQSISATTPTGFILTRGFTVAFIPGFSNTDATTLSVSGSTPTPIFRRTSDGIFPLVGGEIIASTWTVATYDGTQFQLLGGVVQVPIGTVLDTTTAVADPGFVLMQGQCLSTTGAFHALWLKMGSPGTGTCAAGQFPIPDGRGRVVAMIDSGGSGRISAAGGNFDGTLMYNSGGNQNHTLIVNEIPAGLFASVSGTLTGSASGTLTGGTSAAVTGQGSEIVVATGGGGAIQFSTLPTAGLSVSVSGTLASSDSGTLTGSAGGGGAAHTILQPTLMLNRQVKY